MRNPIQSNTVWIKTVLCILALGFLQAPPARLWAQSNTSETERAVNLVTKPALSIGTNSEQVRLHSSDVYAFSEVNARPSFAQGDTTVILYDDGTIESNFSGNIEEYAVRFTPETYPVDLIYLVYFPGGEVVPDTFGVKVYLDAEASNSGPKASLLNFEGEVSFDSTGTNIAAFSPPITVAGGDFYIALNNIPSKTQEFRLGLDTDSDARRSWLGLGGDDFRLLSDFFPIQANFAMRAVVVTSDPATGVEPGVEVPTQYSLEPNYPNPFNPSTEIRFDLPEAVHVQLLVYDVMGREVARLVDQHLHAGTHAVTWDASGLPSGLYLYRLTADAFTETKAMTLLK